MNTSSSFGQWLRQRRKALDLTQKDLAYQVGCAVTTIQKFERNLRRPSKQIAERLADVLAITLDERPAFVTFARRTEEVAPTFPAQRVFTGPPSNLPVHPTPFAGRANELAQIAERLADPACRLLTLVGPGGIGKTRLAIEAAAKCTNAFAQGVYFVSLASVGSPGLLASAIAVALTISFYSSDDPEVQIVNYLRDMQLLLVVDNFEHLLDEVGLLTSLLAQCRKLKILVTSRERLNMREEWVLTIEGLPCPPLGQVDKLDTYSSVQLFMQCARRIQPGFALTDDPEAVVAVCEAVGGMPLGIELATTWLRVMPCRQIAPQIQLDFDFLAAPLRDLPERHQSLRAVFDQSWRLLSETERQVLDRLSIFRGGFDFEAAKAVAGATLRVLAGLVDKSLLRLHPSRRYDLHEHVRQYAARHLAEAGETAAIGDRHLEFFLGLARQVEPMLLGAAQVVGAESLEADLDNLRAALAWSLDTGRAEMGLQLATSLYRFWHNRGYWYEGRQWLEKMLARNTAPLIPGRADALSAAAMLALRQEDLPVALTRAQEALELYRAANNSLGIGYVFIILGDIAYSQYNDEGGKVLLEQAHKLLKDNAPKAIATHAIHSMGAVAWRQGDFDRAATLYKQALKTNRELDNLDTIAFCLLMLGHIAYSADKLAEAKTRFETCLPIAHQVRNRWLIAESLGGLGQIALRDGQYDRAEALLQESLGRMQELMRTSMVASNLCYLGHLALALGDPDLAKARFAQALSLVEKGSEIAMMVRCLSGLAMVAVASGGEGKRAVWLLGASTALLDSAGRKVLLDHIALRRLADTNARLQSELDPEEFEAAWSQGQAMTLEQVMTYALETNA